MPEKNTKIISKFEGEANPDPEILKLGKKITDVVAHKINGIKSTDPEYWGLREVVTHDMAVIANKMKLRKFYFIEELIKMNPEFEPAKLQNILTEMANIGIIEYDYGDLYDDNGPLKENIPETKAKRKRYRICFYVPGSAELFNSTKDRIEKNPAVASFFERMTFIPLAGITQMVPPGGDGIGMHVIPVEKAIGMENQSVNIEKISYWLKKYNGHISAGTCSCRLSRSKLRDGCADDPDDWCIQVGDMADYCVETNRAHYITKEEALRIIKRAEENGFVHQITNIDGQDKIFDICNCNVNICNALRTSLLFNTPNLSRSAYTAKVDPKKCVACGYCVEVCPAGAVKLGQKFCDKNNKPIKYPSAPLPDNLIWGKYAWDENYRDTARMSNSYETGTAPCKTACPAHVPVQAYLKKAHEGKYLEALALIKKELPFPAVCGRICNKRCEEACTRGNIDKAVAIDSVKKFLAELELNSKNRYIPEKIIPSVHDKFEEKIAIIGAGPAGLSAAYFLALKGYSPTVFEKNNLPGGMLTYGIPTYKLEKNVIFSEIEIIKKLGVEIKTNIEVGKDISLNELRKQGYKAFYIAIGCQGGKRPGIINDNAKGTFIAVDYLKNCYENQSDYFEGNVTVIGGGNVAIDCARSALRLKAKKVTMVSLESREIMPASKDEIKEAEEEGINILNCYGPKEIRVDEKNEVNSLILKKCVSVSDPKTKAFSPQYDENDCIELKTDRIIFAIGQSIIWGNLLSDSKVTYFHGNYPLADKFTYQTAQDDIFVGGDCFTGPKFAIDAIAQGHYAAESLHRYVQPEAHMTIGRNRHNFVALNKQDITIPSYDTAGRQDENLQEESISLTFRDTHKTLSEQQVKIETARCLSCGVSRVDPHKCIGCGLCTTKCHFDAIHLFRDHPEMSKMVVAEKKVGGLLSYSMKRWLRILGHLPSKEARTMAKKRKLYKKEQKNLQNTNS